MLELDLNSIAAWVDMLQLNLSLLKTFLLYIGSKNPKQVNYINSTALKGDETIKDLGVHISNDLPWSKTVN